MADVHRRIEASGFLRGLARSDFAGEAGRIIGDVNYVHPFREGNGRTQALYLQQLSGQAGHWPTPAPRWPTGAMTTTLSALIRALAGRPQMNTPPPSPRIGV